MHASITRVRNLNILGGIFYAVYMLTDGQCVSHPGNPTKGNDLEEGCQDELDDYWKSTSGTG